MKWALHSLKCWIKNLWTEHELAQTVETRSDGLGINWREQKKQETMNWALISANIRNKKRWTRH